MGIGTAIMSSSISAAAISGSVGNETVLGRTGGEREADTEEFEVLFDLEPKKLR